MRKSERIRLLEMQMVRMEYELDYMKACISAMLERENVKAPEMDAGKWYSQRFNNNKN
jgi:hypothetical protein